MDLNKFVILISSVSFYAYTIHYFTSSKMKSEFKRFGLEKLGLFVIMLQFFGATGLMIGLKFNTLLSLSSLGLALLMLSGLIVRLKLKDNIWVSLPATFYMGLNAYIFIVSID